MADPELLKILSQGVMEWNQWWKANAGESGFDLTNADLESANLNGATFTFADLSGANLSNAQLKKTAFHFANLNGARLGGANLEWAGFTGASLVRADLKEAKLDGAFIKGADLTEANLEGVGFAEADLSRSVLHRTKLADADFIDARLFGTRFWQADLRRVKLHGAFLYAVNLNDSDVTDAELGFTTFSNCDLGDVIGLDTVKHHSPSSIGIDTIFHSKNKIPKVFLRGCGLPEAFIARIPALIASMEPVQFYSCFISYSSKDQNFAETLYTDLQDKGVRCFLASEDLKIGAEIRARIDEAIQGHDKLLLVLSEFSIESQWVQQEVETALAKEREQGRTVLFPIRLDDAVMGIGTGWPAYLKNTRNIGDFTRWKEPDSYSKAVEKLLSGLKSEDKDALDRLMQDALQKRAVFSPRNTIREEWDKVEESVVQLAKRVGLIEGEGLVDCGQLINQLYEAGKISGAVRERFFFLSKMHLSTAFNSYSSVEPGTALAFANEARELQKALTIDTPPLR